MVLATDNLLDRQGGGDGKPSHGSPAPRGMEPELATRPAVPAQRHDQVQGGCTSQSCSVHRSLASVPHSPKLLLSQPVPDVPRSPSPPHHPSGTSASSTSLSFPHSAPLPPCWHPIFAIESPLSLQAVGCALLLPQNLPYRPAQPPSDTPALPSFPLLRDLTVLCSEPFLYTCVHGRIYLLLKDLL